MTLAKSSMVSLLVALVVLSAAALGLAAARNDRATGNAYVRGDVTPVSAKVAGLVAEVLVADNAAVRAGDVLFRIDDRDYRARVAEARAMLAARKASIRTLDRSLAQQGAAVRQAQAGLQGALAEAERAGRELSRIEALLRDGWVTQARADQAVAAAAAARAGVAAAQAGLAAAEQQVGVLESRRPQLLADVEAADAALRLAEVDLESTAVRAPADGRVAERQARRGQYARPGAPLIALVSREVWVVANFKETELRGLRVGEPVSVIVDSLPGHTFAGRVESLSPASGAHFALLPPENATGNFTRIVQRFAVRITLRDGQLAQATLRPGMSVRVRRGAGA